MTSYISGQNNYIHRHHQTNIRKDMPLAEYIKLKSLNLRLRAVKKIRYLTTFKNRKMIAEGIFISKVSYLITLW